MQYIKKIARSLTAAGLAIVLTTGIAFASVGTATVTADALRLRSEANTGSRTLATVYKGSKVELLSLEENGWYKVNYNGKEGYMSAQWLDVVLSSESTGESPAEDPTVTGTITAYLLNIRSGPGVEYECVAKLSKGTQVTVLESANGWCKISDGTTTGYASAAYISTGSTSAGSASGSSGSTGSAATQAKTQQGLVMAGPLNVRSGPGTSYARVGSLQLGTTVEILGSSSGWYQISSGSVTGYVSGQYVTLLEDLGSSPVGAAAAAMAASLVGCRYVYGAEGPNTFDCSGLSYYIFGQLGYKLGRGASAQYSNNGKFVTKDNLQPGDLVFFFDPKYDYSGGTLPTTHMGIYVGNGQFIHASTTSYRVQYDSLFNSYYTKYIVGYKRIG